MKYTIHLDSTDFVVSLDNGTSATVDGQPVRLDVSEVAPNTYSVLMDGQSFRIIVRPKGKGHTLLVGTFQMDGGVESERETLIKQYAQTTGSDLRRAEIRAPMPALVVKLEVKQGDEVTAGQGLLILEAMKMENELKASHPGRIREIHVAEGAAVEKGQLLILLE